MAEISEYSRRTTRIIIGNNNSEKMIIIFNSAVKFVLPSSLL
jgi:hypothetical protein